jgi:hypothetical protein
MSLVAYGASDDSEESDIEDNAQDNRANVEEPVQHAVEKSQPVDNEEISDSDSDNDVRNDNNADDIVLNDKLRGTISYLYHYI